MSIGKIGLNENQKKNFYKKPSELINKMIDKIDHSIPNHKIFITQDENLLLKEKMITTENNIKQTDMINENLNTLIEFALADGELTEKEKQILFKKAEAEGIDLDEFELILEAKLYKFKQAQTPQKVENVSVAPKSDKLGDIKKCPACGAITESFSIKCSDCGTEFRNIEASNSVIKFFEKLDEIEATRNSNFYENKSRNKIGLGTIILWLFFWYILIFFKGLQLLIDKSKSAKWSTTDARKEELIMNYPVPVSREGIFEFLTLSTSKIHSASYFNIFSEDTKYRNAWNRIWLKKIDQITSKASISIKGDSKTFSEVQTLALNAKGIAKENNKKVFHVLGAGVIVILGFLITTSISRKIERNTNATYATVVNSAQKLIDNKQYDEAEKLLNDVDPKHKIEIKSKIQLSQLTEKLNELEPLLQNKKYSKFKLELEKLRWNKISSDYDTESIERESFKNFVKQKEALNNQIPEGKRAEIESEYSL